MRGSQLSEPYDILICIKHQEGKVSRNKTEQKQNYEKHPASALEFCIHHSDSPALPSHSLATDCTQYSESVGRVALREMKEKGCRAQCSNTFKVTPGGEVK